jgi:hypothetical protein
MRFSVKSEKARKRGDPDVPVITMALVWFVWRSLGHGAGFARAHLVAEDRYDQLV